MRLKGRKVPADLWRAVKAENYVRDAVDEAGFKSLVDRVSFLLHKKRQRKRRTSRREARAQQDVDRLIDPREEKRSEVLSRELARLAILHGRIDSEDGTEPVRPHVLSFRETYLGGRTLGLQQAGDFIESDALRYLGRKAFERLGAPLVDHRSRITGSEKGADKQGVWQRLHFEISWQRNRQTTWVQFYLTPRTFEELAFPDGFGHAARTRVLFGSVLDDLRSLSVDLAKHYLWREAEATWFVLTGTPPSIPCFLVSQSGGARNDHVQYRLHLEIQPWVSAKTVMRVYRHLQKGFLLRENRSPRLDSLTLVDFVSERRHGDMPWRRIMEEWNKTYPTEAYPKDGVRNFQRDFEQTYRLVLVGRS